MPCALKHCPTRPLFLIQFGTLGHGTVHTLRLNGGSISLIIPLHQARRHWSSHYPITVHTETNNGIVWLLQTKNWSHKLPLHLIPVFYSSSLTNTLALLIALSLANTDLPDPVQNSWSSPALIVVPDFPSPGCSVFRAAGSISKKKLATS